MAPPAMVVVAVAVAVAWADVSKDLMKRRNVLGASCEMFGEGLGIFIGLRVASSTHLLGTVYICSEYVCTFALRVLLVASSVGAFDNTSSRITSYYLLLL